MGTARIYFRRNCRTRSRPRTRQLRTTLGRHRTSLHHFEVETLARFNSPKAQKRDSGAFAPYAPCAPCAPNPSRNLHTERPQSPFAPLASRSSSACGPCLKSAHMCTCAAAPAGAAKGHQRSAFVAGTLSGGVPCTHAVGRLPRGGACARAPRVRAPPLSSGAFQDARLALCFALPCAALRPRVPPLCTSSAPSMPDCPSTCAREEARCLSVREARQGGAATGASCLVFVRRSLQTHLNMGPSTSCTQPRPVAGRPPASIIARRASAQASKRAPRPPGAHGDAARAAKCHPPRASIQNCCNALRKPGSRKCGATGTISRQEERF